MTEENIQEILQLYETHSIRQIAKKLGVTYNAVRYHLVKNNVKLRPQCKGVKGFCYKPVDEKSIDRIYFLYIRVGMNVTQISKYEGLDKGTVRKRLKLANLYYKDFKASRQISNSDFESMMEKKALSNA